MSISNEQALLAGMCTRRLLALHAAVIEEQYPELDVRFGLDLDGGVYVFSGDGSYDPFHCDVCSAGVLTPDMSREDVRALALDLVNEALDQRDTLTL